MSGSNGATAHVDLGDGDWVEVRTQITYGDRVAVRGKLLGLRMDASGNLPSGPRDLDYLAADLEGMRRLITAWGGPTFCVSPAHPHENDCQPRPITIETIEALPGDKGDLVAAAVQTRGSSAGTPDFTQSPSPAASDTATPAAAPSSVSGSPTSDSSASSAGRGTSS